MQHCMYGLYWYTIFVIIAAFSIAIAVHYSTMHFSENIRKLIIILSLFAIIGITAYPGDSE